MEAVRAARVALRDPTGIKRTLTIASGLAPFACNFAEARRVDSTGSRNLEWFDEDLGRWHRSGGEDGLILYVMETQVKVFGKYAMRLVERDGKQKLEPVLSTAQDWHFEDKGYCETIRDSIRVMLRHNKWYQRGRLNDVRINNNLVHYDCGKTLDLTPVRGENQELRAPPFEARVGEGAAREHSSS